MSAAADDRFRTALRRFDPRVHLAAAIGWTVLVILGLAALGAATIAARETEARARVDAVHLLSEFSDHLRQTLVLDLQTRQAVVGSAAAQILASSDQSSAALKRHLDAVRAQFPEFAWLAVVDADDRAISAAGEPLDVSDLSDATRFSQGRDHPMIGDAHPESRSGGAAPAEASGRAPVVLDIAVPLPEASGRLDAVLVAQLAWRWIEAQQQRLSRALDPGGHLDVLVADHNGIVLMGPTPWLGRAMPSATEFAESGRFLIGQPAREAATSSDPGWTVWVREDADVALSLARVARNTVVLTILFSAMVCALAAIAMARVLTSKLEKLAEQAQAIRQGTQETLIPPVGEDEVGRIGATLAELVAHLQKEKRALLHLNAELDARVVERTARIERLAEGARHAAVTRERLRMARALHDTLAHSLVALLTQIRLVRKLSPRMAEGELEAEMGLAEEAAASGLASAREAITEMRYGGVRDSGLGAAVQTLIDRFGERTGVQATLVTETPASDLADERAELVFHIVEEALHNVERHAQSQAVVVTLKALADVREGAEEPRRIRLEIADDGVGFDASRPHPGHYGLRGMQEQAALIDAQLTLTSTEGCGTRIVLDFDE